MLFHFKASSRIKFSQQITNFRKSALTPKLMVNSHELLGNYNTLNG